MHVQYRVVAFLGERDGESATTEIFFFFSFFFQMSKAHRRGVWDVLLNTWVC